MKKSFQTLIVTASTIFFAALSALSIGIAAMCALFAPLGEGSGAETKNEMVSPDGNATAIVRYISGGSLSSDTVMISVKSSSGSEEKQVGSFLGVDDLYVKWSAKDILSIEYRWARTAKFTHRFIDLNKEIITVDVVPVVSGAE